MHNTILSFIKNFEGARSTFMNGCCYWFAAILQARFGGGLILYDMIDGHFVWFFENHFYDVRGDVSDQYTIGQKGLVYFDAYACVDPTHHARIVHDCVALEER